MHCYESFKLKTEVLLCIVQNINKISCTKSMPKLTVHKIVQNHLRLETTNTNCCDTIQPKHEKQVCHMLCWNVPSKLEDKCLLKWHARENMWYTPDAKQKELIQWVFFILTSLEACLKLYLDNRVYVSYRVTCCHQTKSYIGHIQSHYNSKNSYSGI